MAAISVLLLIAAQRRLERLREGHQAYIETAAATLAQSGIDVGMVAIHTDRPLLVRPLGREIQYSGAIGELEIALEEASGGMRITSCSRLQGTSHRTQDYIVERCVTALTTRGQGPRILEWRER